VLILAAQYEGHDLSIGVNRLLLAGAFLLSMRTYRFFENPIRRARWTAPATAAAALASVGAVILVSGFTLDSVYTKISRSEAVPLTSGVGLLGGAQAPAKEPAGPSLAAALPEEGGALPDVAAAVKAAQRGAALPTGLTPPPGELLNSFYLYDFPEGCSAHEGRRAAKSAASATRRAPGRSC
jgi:hypothetical protein